MKTSILATWLSAACAVLSSPLQNHEIRSIDTPSSTVAKRADYKDMLLYDITTASQSGSTASNVSISFYWADPNSNTTAFCSESWLETSTTSGHPTSYVACQHNNTNEFFQFYFKTYASRSSFTLQLDHTYEDATDFPPPWDYPSFFSTEQVNLTCLADSPLCAVPAALNPVHAVINAMAD